MHTDNEYESRDNNKDYSSTPYTRSLGSDMVETLRTLIFVFNLALIVHQVVYFVIDLISMAYRAKAIDQYGKYAGTPNVAHLSLEVLHMVLIIPSFGVYALGFLSTASNFNPESQRKFSLAYEIGLSIILVLVIILNICDHAAGNIGIGDGYGWSNVIILTVTLISLSIIRRQRL
ncbi:CSFL8 [Acrasis kona]|uniref:CSFL8 n=1 Tax=Acrasis kona TaxID=1008807 RepID=A0AAW2YMF0_9EUKA